MKNEWDVVRKFEEEIAQFGGSEYAVAMESCTFALFLCCKWVQVNKISLPKHTYPGVPCSVIHSGGKVEWDDRRWTGAYQLLPYNIWDSAKRFCPNMYVKNSYWCLSFQAKKRIPIGRGGMVLTNDEQFVEWARVAIRDGKHEVPFSTDSFDMLGWNAYMTPEQASRGLQLFHACKDFEDLIEEPDYPDLSQFPIYTKGLIERILDEDCSCDSCI
jgi:dTDP-4-amino-4,6-dideoxygalactose transaminase